MDRFFFGDGHTYPISQERSGINSNAVIVGGTGSGKTESCVVPMLLNNDERSVVVPISKYKVIRECAGALIDHGYDIRIIDFYGDRSNVNYNPFAYFHSIEDIKNYATDTIVADTHNREDMFWDNATSSVLSAMMHIVNLNAQSESQDRIPSMQDLKTFYETAEILADNYGTDTDKLFDYLNDIEPGNFATCAWHSFRKVADRTRSCIATTLNTGTQKLFSEKTLRLSSSNESFDFRSLGRKKTALFIVTSPTDRYLDSYINLMYTQIIKELLTEADQSPDYILPIPVQLIFDDFACGSVINNFEREISIFRAAGISATILLQSESQLYSCYDYHSATTILNNCDNYVYLGGNDWQTCKNIAEKTGKDPKDVLAMPPDNVIIIRRGSMPVTTRRYRIYDDPNYIKYLKAAG